jgi:hypothetical protein
MKQSSFSSRRKFLENAGKALVACYILPRHILGGKGFIAPSDRLTLAFIGTGHQGQQDMQLFHQTQKAVVGFL